jgi:dihydroorotate dehydrogenase
MYKQIIRPLLFCLSAENAHKLIIGALRLVGCIPGTNWLMEKICTIKHPALEREVFGVKFKNPIGIAAGFDKNAEVYNEFSALGYGFVEVGTITPKGQPGNPRPRLFRLPKDKAIINRMGFNNHGMQNAIENLHKRRKGVVVGANIGKNSLTPIEEAPSDYLKLFRNLYQYVDYFVVNVSCPNVAKVTSLQNKQSVTEILEPLFEFRRGQSQYRPILLKISPDLDDASVDDMTDVMIETPLDGIVATNTTTSRAGLTTSAKSIEAIGNGGLSGAPLTKRAVEVVRRVHTRCQGRYPIIGVGGVMTVEDAKAMLDAGASLVEIYSGFIFEGPALIKNIIKYLENTAK